MVGNLCPTGPVASWKLPAGTLLCLHKARENYVCANCALSHGFFNVAASRFYYALALASTEFLQKKGCKPNADANWQKGELWKRIKELTGKEHYESLLMNCYAERLRADYAGGSARQARVAKYAGPVLEMLEDMKAEVTAPAQETP